MIDYALLENDVDAWYSDAWKDCYSEPLCYCADCRRQFAADFGEDLYDPAFGPQGERVEEVRSWYHNRLVRMVQEFHAYIKSKKNLPTIINGIAGVLGYESQGVWGREIDDIHDVLHFERKTEPYNHYASASCMRVCGRDGWIYSGLYSPLQFDGPERAADMIEDEHRFPYRKELYCESLLTFACGHSVNVIRANTLAFDESSPGIDDLTDIFTFAREHAELLEGLSYRPSLAVYNEETARHELQDEVFRGLVRAGVQATILKREHLDDLSLLSRFQAIVSRSRDEAANEKLCRYAREGGLLVTTQDLAQQCFPLCAKQGDALMHGRGYVLQHGRPEDAEGLLAAVETKACLPYRVTYPEGELIPVLTANEGTAALYLVNITRHLTGLFDEGLAEIPEVRDVTVRWNAGKPRSVHTLRGGKLAVCETQDGLEIRLDGVKEFEVLILEL